MFKVSHSKVKTWRRCRYLYDLKYVRKLRRRVKGRPLMFGSIIHEAIEAKFTGKPVEPVFAGYEKQISKMFVEERIEYGLDSVVPDARVLYSGYVDHWKKDGLKYLAIELDMNENSQIEISPGIIFIGKVDALVHTPESRNPEDVWVFERKTCKTMPEERIRNTDVQTVLYWHFVPQIKKKSGRRILDETWPVPKGIIWDYVRSKPPSVPEPLKNGGFSRAAIDTTWPIYRQAVVDAGLDPKDYTDMEERLRGAEASFYDRIRLPFSAILKEHVVAEFTNTAIEMSILHGIAKDRNLTFDCQRCEFYGLCQAELRGLDTDLMIKKEYEVRKDEKEDSANE